MKKAILLIVHVLVLQIMTSQEQILPLKEIPQADEQFSTGSVVARMIEGLGHRYYWASKDLTEKDLAYKPSADARNMKETLEHLYGLSAVIKNGPTSTANGGGDDPSKYSYSALRKMTLENLSEASKLLRGKNSDEVSKMKVIFDRGGRKSELPFWNMINGPIADAIYHTGQIVTMRRSNGNPIHPGVNVFMGTTKE